MDDRGRLWVDINNVWCSNAAEEDGQSSLDVKFLTLRSRPHSLLREFNPQTIKLPFGPVTRTQTSLPEQDRELAARRQRGDISRDWRVTSTPTALKICGSRFKMSQATKAGAPHPHCRMSRTGSPRFDLLSKDSAVKAAVRNHNALPDIRRTLL